jgi:hypothetical protein
VIERYQSVIDCNTIFFYCNEIILLVHSLEAIV